MNQCLMPASRSRTPTPVMADPQRPARPPRGDLFPEMPGDEMGRDLSIAGQERIDEVGAQGRGGEGIEHIGGRPACRSRRGGGGCRAGSGVPNVGHGNDAKIEQVPDIVQHGTDPRTEAIDLVDEDRHRQAEAAYRARQAACLRLHAFDGGDHENHRIEGEQRPLDLRDEIGVAGGVDQVDVQIVEGEGRPRPHES